MTILGEMLREDALMEGRAEGRAEGRQQTIIMQVCKKLKKGKNVEQIAEALEEEVSYIERIYQVAQKYAPDYDEEKVYKEILGENR